LVEQLIRNQQVVGSSPTAGSKILRWGFLVSLRVNVSLVGDDRSVLHSCEHASHTITTITMSFCLATGLVFTSYRICKPGKGETAELLSIRFHDLRHSAASLLIAEGVELVEVSVLLGHSELRVTADLYSHLQQQTAAKAARTMDRILGVRN
jgi:Phage integrase family